ncbi:MAG TPA: hypothetical protein VGE09_08550 [Pseudoxanthomonas sp.]
MKTLAIVVLLALSGCGVATMNQTREAYQRALTNYRECVNAKGPGGCASERAILDADSAAYRNVRTDNTIVVQE